jgi:hypothetical protein
MRFYENVCTWLFSPWGIFLGLTIINKHSAGDFSVVAEFLTSNKFSDFRDT